MINISLNVIFEMNYERARSGSGYFLVEKEYFEENGGNDLKN